MNKRDFQRKLNCMSVDAIDNIETNLAEKIISEYNTEKKDLKINRYNYLKSKTQHTSQIITRRDEKFEKKINLVKTQKEHKKGTKRMRIILNGVEKKLINIKKRPMTKFDYLYKNI